MKIEKSSHGYWVEYKQGRSRYIPFGTEAAERIAKSLTLDLLRKDSYTRTHDKMVYTRDKDGKIGIPPDPSMIPTDCERFEVKSLREADSLRREMEADLREQYSHDYMTDYLDNAQGNPRDVLMKTQPMSNFERDLIYEMVKELDREAEARSSVNTNVSFAWRES